jgi:hypothetical protein
VPKDQTDARLEDQLIKLDSFLEEAKVYHWETVPPYRPDTAQCGHGAKQGMEPAARESSLAAALLFSVILERSLRSEESRIRVPWLRSG